MVQGSWLKVHGSRFTILIQLFSFCFFLSCHLSPVTCHLSYAQDSKEEESLFVAKKAFEDGFYEVSLGLLERFLKNYPDSPKAAEAELLTGECFFHQNKYLDALNKFEDTLKDPRSVAIKDAVFYWIAEVNFKGNNFQKAAEYYKKVIDQFSNSAYIPAAYYSLGWSLFQEHDFKGALEYFKTVETKFPKEAQGKDASFKVIECLYNLKDYSALKERLKGYFKANPQDKDIQSFLYFYLGEAEYYLNNFPEAAEAYAKAISNTPDEKAKLLSQLGLAWSYLKMKRYQEAQDSFAQIKPESLEKSSRDIFLLGQAIMMSETNRFTQARDLYSQLIGATGDPLILIQAYLGKADTFYNTSDYPQAISIYKEALNKAENDSLPAELVDKAHYSLAWAFLKQAEFKEAIKEFQKIVKTSDDKVVKESALCQIGDAYQDSGDYLKAEEAYDTILNDYPDSFYGDYVQYQLGLTMLKASNYDAAILAFSVLKKNYPQSKLLDDASYTLGLAYFQRQDYNASKEVFEKFQEEYKESNLRPQAVYLLGTSLYNLGKYQEAIEVFKNIIRQFAQDKELAQKAEYEVADCFYQMGNEKEAMDRFKMLRSKYPDSGLTADVIWWLGEYYYRHNDLMMARRYFSSLIQDFPNSYLVPEAYYALGTSYAQEAKFAEATGNFKKVISFGKSELAAQAAIAIADIYVRQENVDSALSVYNEILQSYPNLANLIYPKMADLFYKSAEYDKALDFYRKAIDLVSLKEIPAIQLKIAETQEAAGRRQEAVEEYLKVAYLYPDSQPLTVKSLLRVAQIYEDKQDYKEALGIYQKIISLKVEEAKFAQERIDSIKEHEGKGR